MHLSTSEQSQQKIINFFFQNRMRSKMTSNGLGFGGKTKTVQILLMLPLSFIICWLPLTTIYLIISLVKLDRNILMIFIILSHLSPMIDALIFAYWRKDIRDTINSVLNFHFFKRN